MLAGITRAHKTPRRLHHGDRAAHFFGRRRNLQTDPAAADHQHRTALHQCRAQLYRVINGPHVMRPRHLKAPHPSAGCQHQFVISQARTVGEAEFFGVPVELFNPNSREMLHRQPFRPEMRAGRRFFTEQNLF